MQEFLDLFKKTGGSLKSKCSCAVSYEFLQKQEMSTVYLRPFLPFLSLLGHPRVTLLPMLKHY